MNKTVNKEKYYITTAIAYASRKPHFGNTYEVIATDAIARFKRAMGYDVFFCTGTDEHGQKIEELAKEQGITPQLYVDGVADEIKGVWNKMHTSYDYFIRTTDDYHVKAVQKIFEIACVAFKFLVVLLFALLQAFLFCIDQGRNAVVLILCLFDFSDSPFSLGIVVDYKFALNSVLDFFPIELFFVFFVFVHVSSFSFSSGRAVIVNMFSCMSWYPITHNP